MRRTRGGTAHGLDESGLGLPEEPDASRFPLLKRSGGFGAGCMHSIWNNDRVIAHSARLAASHHRWTGRALGPTASNAEELARALFEAPFVIVSHGTEADPVLNYGNAAALALWEMDWDELIRTPSRLTAEAPERTERARLLSAVTTHGFIDDYSGIRISRRGTRFRIARATVWNLVTAADAPAGQAATFSDWTYL